jgi:hypothetical protein
MQINYLLTILFLPIIQYIITHVTILLKKTNSEKHQGYSLTLQETGLTTP